MTAERQTTSERRSDLDWLRIILFGLLVPHHVAVGFVAFGRDIYGFVNDQLGGPLLGLAIYFSHSWRLPSLFLISGIGTYFATRRRTGVGFLGSRVARLLVPALFGTFILNVSIGYTVAVMQGSSIPFLEFWWNWLVSPEPRQVGHLWFLYNLTFYTVLCWPIFMMGPRIEGWQISPGILLATMGIGIVLVAVLAKPFASALAGDGYQWPWYLAIFLSGYLVGAHHKKVLDWSAKWVWWLMAAAFALFVVEVSLLASTLAQDPVFGNALAEGGWAAKGLAPAFGALTLTFTLAEKSASFLFCLTALGLAARYLKRQGFLLQPLNQAVFPLYVLHFPLTIMGLALLTQTTWPWFFEFVLLTLGVYVLSFGIYFMARYAGPLVFLIGGRVRRPSDK